MNPDYKEFYYSLDVSPRLGTTLDIGDYSYIITCVTPLEGTDSMYKIAETDLTVERKRLHAEARESRGG